MMNKPENIAALREVREALDYVMRYLPDGCNAAEDDGNKALSLLDKLLSDPEPNNVGDDRKLIVHEDGIVYWKYSDGSDRCLTQKDADLINSTIRQHLSGDGWWDDPNASYQDVIDANHPTITGDHKTYAEALKLVGQRHSKYALVDLVNWLLVRCKTSHKTEHGE